MGYVTRFNLPADEVVEVFGYLLDQLAIDDRAALLFALVAVINNATDHANFRVADAASTLLCDVLKPAPLNPGPA